MTQDELLKLIDQAAVEGWKELDLAGADLTELPPEIGKLTQLETLILAKEVDGKYLGNDLTQLPTEIKLLHQLNSLRVFGNWRYKHKSIFRDAKSGNQLSEVPPEIGHLSNLQQLDLRSNQLSEVPPEIRQLSNLQQLDLRFNQLSEVPPEIEHLSNLQQLNLRENQLSQLPPEIGQLSNLQQLDLRSNQLSEVPPEIEHLSNLQQLNLRENQLSQLPPEIVQLTHLQQLDLSHNQLGQLPPEICQFKNLQRLILEGTQLNEIPTDIVQLTNLEYLSLRENQLSKLPLNFSQLTSLQELDLSSNRLSSLPLEIFQLTSLRILNLSFNKIAVIPPETGNLENLDTLSVSGNLLTQLPLAIANCSKLTRLDISSNKFESIPKQIFKIKSLEHFAASANNLTYIPAGMEKLRKLSVIRLGQKGLDVFRRVYSFDRGNKIRSFPKNLRHLPNLKELELVNNEIRELPAEVFDFSNLEEIDLRGNPISIPPEILGPKELWQDPGILHEILDYYFQVLDPSETEPLYESKFIIVGEGGAGKTTLAKKLLNPDYNLDFNEKSTEGIDVLHWEFNQTSGTPFRSNIWDFGGQEIYHATHQFFLTKRSLYVLVVDTRQDNTDLYYWLNVVSLLSDSSPVLIIKNEKQDRQCAVNERPLRAEFTNLEKVLAVNLANNRGLDAVKNFIQKRIVQLPHVGTPLPKVWVRVRSALENYANACNYITLDEYRNLCCTSQLTDSDRQRSLSSYLHDLGVILHFHEDPILKRYVILKPEWGTAAVYEALDTQEIRENFGRFTRTQLDTIWSKDEYANMHDELLQLMMRFKLCYEIPGCLEQYIAPQLLSTEQPDYPWEDSSNLILRYRYDFMPKGILTRLIVELHEFIENQTLVWKTGVVFTNGTAHAEVTEHYSKSEIRIRVSGSDQKRWLSAITHELEKIHRSYEHLKYKTLIPCNCSSCKDNKTPHDYPYQRLQKFLSDGQYQIQCQESYQMVDVRQLLDDILYQNLEGLLAEQERYSPQRYLSDLEHPQGLPIQPNELVRINAPTQTYQPSKKVFISYAWGGDSEEITNKIDKAFQSASIELIRDKRDLGFKGRIKEFMQQIGRGKAVVIIISDKYLKSENCMFELVEIAANDSFYERIFPIVLDDTQIYKPVKRIRYIQHWEQEIADLEEAMKSVSAANMQGFRDAIDLYTRIRATIAELTETLKDMNTLTPEIHTESGFAELISAIEKRLES